MLTKGKTSNFRAVKYVVTIVALIAVLALCFTACGKAAPTKAEYVAGTLDKATYNLGETFDCTGAEIQVTYDNGAAEKVAVTPAMVGDVKLNTIGIVNVTVTYVNDGVSVNAIIPVTVVDPNADAKTNAIVGINANATVVANSADKGVALIVKNYTDLINAATSKADIDTLAAKFATEVKAFADAKAAAKAAIEGETFAGIFDQFKPDLVKAQNDALTALKNATTEEAIKDIKDDFTAAIILKLQEQAEIKGDGSDTSDALNDQKDALILKIREYKKALNAKKALVEANCTDATVLDNYLAMYDDTIEDFRLYELKIAYAIDLSDLAKEIDETAMNALRTEIDDIYDLLVGATDEALSSAITVVPAPWVEDESNAGVYALGTDAIKTLLDKITTLKDAAATKYGDATVNGADGWMKKYDPLDVAITNTINLQDFVDDITAEWNIVNGDQTDATNNVISAINAAIAAKGTADEATKVNDAWAALKTWGADNGIFTQNTAITAIPNNLVFESKNADAIFQIVFDGTEVKTADRTAYDYTLEHVITYYVYNYDALVDATIVLAENALRNLVAAIPEDIVFSYTAEDSFAAIDAATKARDNFIRDYGMEIYNKYCLDEVNGEATDVLLAQITAADEEWDTLVVMAAALNEKIANLPTADLIKIEDYVGVEGADGALKVAYDDYKAFATRNANANGKHTDVIANVGNAGTTNNEEKLLGCVDQYTALAFADAKEVEGNLTVYAAAKIKADGLNKNTETAYRQAITKYADAKVADINAVAYDSTGIDNFNRIEILDKNVESITEMAEGFATVIENATSADDLALPVAP